LIKETYLTFTCVEKRTDNTMTKRRTNNDLQNTTQKTKERATHTQLKTGNELR
jgi:hypothetical protein